MKRLAVITGAAIIAAFGILPCCIVHGTAAAAPQQNTTATTNLHIEGMTCGGCAMAVKLVLQKTSGVIGSTVSYEKKSAVVTYDPAKTTPAKVAEAVASALSYKVNVEGATARVVTAEPAATATGKTIALPSYRQDTLRAAFNKDADHVRVIALLSPTCAYCQKGQRVVQSVFEKYPNDERLRGFVVWLPMLPTDNQRAAGAQAGTFIDARVAQQWDGDRASGEAFAKMLGLKREAWDVYLLYAPGVKWTGEAPPSPTFWMHQLRADSGADLRGCLNPTVFLNKVAGLLAERKSRA
jgi:copper chaperone CopZ